MQHQVKKNFSHKNSTKQLKRRTISPCQSSKTKCKIVSKSSKKKKPNLSFRNRIITIFNNLKIKHMLKWETIFLAVHIFDKTKAFQEISQMLKRALACFMIALKEQQVIRPSLEQIGHYMGISMKYIEYIELEFQTFKKMDFLIYVKYPTTILKQKGFQYMNHKNQTFFLLDLALKNVNISWKFPWEQIVEGIWFLVNQNYEDKENEVSINLQVLPLLEKELEKYDTNK